MRAEWLGLFGVRLTATEYAIADLVAAGYTNPQIAAELGVSEQTVRDRLSTIYRKFDFPPERDRRVLLTLRMVHALERSR